MRRKCVKSCVLFSQIIFSLVFVSCGASFGNFVKSNEVKAIKKAAIISIASFKEVDTKSVEDTLGGAISSTVGSSSEHLDTKDILLDLKNKIFDKKMQCSFSIFYLNRKS